MTNVKHVSYYTNVMQGWAKAEHGPKPTEAQLSLAHVFGRPGKQSMAIACALRDGGVSGQQIKLVSSLFDGKATPQLNHLRDLIAAGMFDREPVSGAYVIRLTGKGQTFVDLHAAKTAPVVAAKPVKAKAKRKAKVTVAPVTVEAPVIEAPAAADQPTA